MAPAPRRSDAAFGPDGRGLGAVLAGLAPALPAYLARQRWFRAKGRVIAAVALADHATLPVAGVPCVLALLDVGYADGLRETYFVPAAARPVAAARAVLGAQAPPLGRLGAPDGEWLVYDGLDDPAVGAALLRQMEDASRLHGAAGVFAFDRTPVLSQATGGLHPAPLGPPRRLRGEQTNTSLVYDDRLVLKVLRGVEVGENPDLEVSRFLTFRAGFRHVPRLAGFGRYQGADGARTVGLLHTFVPNRGDAWTWTLAALRDFYAAVQDRPVPGTTEGVLAGVGGLAGDYLLGVRRLGEVTGELHAALGSDPDDPDFAPEPVTPTDLAAWGAAVARQVDAALEQVQGAMGAVAPADRLGVDRFVAAAPDVRARIGRAVGRLVGAALWKTRTHGDYHLGQVLRMADQEDFVVLDFEGEPARPLAERRARHSPLRDVAGMLRSFTYASYAGLFAAAGPDAALSRRLSPWRASWETAAADAFVQGYLAMTVGRGVRLVPADSEVRGLLLSLFCLERAAYELGYELNNRPAWLPIPLAAFERELAA
jgi:trehalose synthase-fused probable maltokinase